MCCAFAHPKLLSRLAHCCIIVDYIISYIYNPFFNISFQIKTPAYLFVQFMQGWGKYTI